MLLLLVPSFLEEAYADHGMQYTHSEINWQSIANNGGATTIHVDDLGYIWVAHGGTNYSCAAGYPGTCGDRPLLKLDSSGNIISEMSSIAGSSNCENRFGTAWGVIVTSSRIFIMSENTCIVTYDSSGNYLGTTNPNFGSKMSHWDNPLAFDVDSNGYIWIADSRNHRISQWSQDGYSFTGFNIGGGNCVDTDPQFLQPPYLSTNQCVQQPNSSQYPPVAGSGDYEFQHTKSLAIDSSNNIYVLDDQLNRVQKFTNDGTFITKWSGFSNPKDIAVDPSGNVYVLDAGTSKIQVFSNSGNLLHDIESDGSWNFTGLGNCTFSCMDIDSSGKVYVVDDTRIHIFDAVAPDTTPPVVLNHPSGQDMYDIVIYEATDASGMIIPESQFPVLTATDDVDGSLSVTCTPSSTTLFPVGTTLVTCTATDAAGNTGSRILTVTIAYTQTDTTPPTIGFRIAASDHPDNIAGNGNLTPGQTLVLTPESTDYTFVWWIQLSDDVDGFPGHWRSGLLYNYPAPGETPYHSCSVDGFEIPKSNEDVGNGSADYGSGGYDSGYEGYNYYYKFPIGTSTVTCTASDIAGNVATAGFNVTVIEQETADTTPFTTVQTDLGGGHVCIGYENAPAGTTHVSVVYNGMGQNYPGVNTHVMNNGIRVAIDSHDASCLFNSSTSTWSAAVNYVASPEGEILPGYWWVEAFDDPSDYNLIGGYSANYAESEGTSTPIFLENIIPLPSAADTTPPVLTINPYSSGPTSGACWGAAQDPWLVDGIMILESICPGGTIVNVEPALTVADDVGVTSGPDCDSPTNFSSPGDTTVTCTATDAAGNVGSITFTVRVVILNPDGTTPPAITWLDGTPFSDQTFTTGDSTGYSHSFGLRALDNVTIMNFDCNSNVDSVHEQLFSQTNYQYYGVGGSGTAILFPIGSTSISCTATDDEGTMTTEMFTVTVVLEEAADTSNFNTIHNYFDSDRPSCIGFENAPAGTQSVVLLHNTSGVFVEYNGASIRAFNHLPTTYDTSWMEEVGMTPGSCLQEGENFVSPGEYKVAAYDLSQNLIGYSTPIVLDQWLSSDYPWYMNGPTLIVPDDITVTTTGASTVAWGTPFTVTLSADKPVLSMSEGNLFCNADGADFGGHGFNVSHPIHTSTLQTLQVIGDFEVGTTTITCNGYGLGGINANRNFGGPDNPFKNPYDEFPTFDITVVLGEASADTTGFNTVQTFDSQGWSCIGYENVPSGTGHVRLLGPQQGNSAWYYEDYQWLSGAGVGGGTSCTNNQLAGEYKFAAFSGSLTSNVNIGSLIEFATPIIVEEYQFAPPTVIPPADITQTTADPAGAIVTFSATAVQGTLPIHPDYPVCSKYDSSTGFSGIEASGTLFPVGNTTVLCMAYDTGMGGMGGSEIVSFEVTVVLEAASDTIPPTITAENITQSATNSVGTAVIYNITTSDNSGVAPSLTCTIESGSFFQTGTTPVTCTARDEANNTTTAEFTVTVNYTALADTEPPTLSIPDDISKTVSIGQGTIVTYSLPTATDNYGVTSGPTCTPESGTTFPVGNTIVTCTAADAEGNTTTDTFTITVIKQGEGDVTPPTFQIVSGDIEIDATTANGAIVGYPIPGVTDNVGVTSGPTCTPESGSFFPVGKTTVTCIASDAAGNQGSTVFIVNVQSQIAVPETVQTSVSIAATKATYSSNEVISATGNVSPVTDDQLIFRITDSQDNVIAIEQKTPTQIGTYTVSFTPNMLWSTTGTYEITALYGTSEENTSFYFELLEEEVIEQPVDVADNPTNLDVFLTDLQENQLFSAEIGDTIQVDAKLYRSHLGTVEPKSNETVFLSVENETSQVLLQSLNTDFGGNVGIKFTLQESFAPGVYTVNARSLGNGWEMNSVPLTFTVTKPAAQVSVSEVLSTTDQGETVSTYDAGNLAYFNTKISSNTNTPVLVTINVFDAQNNTLGVGFFKSTIGAGESEIVLGFELPKDTASGVASVYTNVFTDWPDRGGVLITDEVQASVNIIGTVPDPVAIVEPEPEPIPELIPAQSNLIVSQETGSTLTTNIQPEPEPQPMCGKGTVLEDGKCVVVTVPIDGMKQIIVENVAGSSTPGCEPNCFMPSIASIKEGGTVIFRNSDTASHTSTSGTPSDGPTGVWDSSLIMVGSSYSVKLDESGTYPYFCMVHPWMTGLVVVGDGTVIDKIPPILDIPARIFETIDAQTSRSMIVTWNSSAVDNVDGKMSSGDVQCTPGSGSYFPIGRTSVTCTATDSSGNKTSDSFDVVISHKDLTDGHTDSMNTVVDNALGSSTPGCEPNCFMPSIASIKEGGTVIFRNSDTAAHTSTSGTPSDGPTGVWDSSLVMPGGSFTTPTLEVGEYPYFCMVHPWMTGLVVVNQTGQEINDTAGPEFIPKPESIHIQSNNPLGSIVDYQTPLVTDESLILENPTCTPVSGTLFPIGKTTVTCNSTDVVGNTSTLTFTVTVDDSPADEIAPTLIVPSSLTYKMGSSDIREGVIGSAQAYGKTKQMNFDVSAIDDSGYTTIPKCKPPSGTFFPIGTTTVTCSVSDAIGNTTSSSFDVHILAYDDNSDKTPPTITALNDVTKYVGNGSLGGFVTYPIPSVYDNVGVTFGPECVPISGSMFMIGTTQITCIASDDAGNTSSSNFNIIIKMLGEDKTSPSFSETSNIIKTTTNQTGLIIQYATPMVTDQSPLDGAVTCNPPSGSLFPIGNTVVGCKVSDLAGNIGITAFSVIVILDYEVGN